MNAYKEFVDKLTAGVPIGPGGSLELEFILLFSGTLAFPIHTTITWNDDSGQAGRWESTLN